MPVGTAMIIVAAVKYARVSTSNPTVNMWCAHTINPTIEIPTMAQIIPRVPNGSNLAVLWATICEIAPNPGRIKMYTSG